MCKVTMFIAISSKFLWASFYHRYVRNDQRVSPQDPRPREEDHTVYWLVSGLNTNGDVESHPPEKKNPHIHHAFWGVLNIRRKDPVNSATSWIDCGGFSSRFFCRNHLLYRHVVACLSLPKKHHLTQEFTNPV